MHLSLRPLGHTLLLHTHFVACLLFCRTHTFVALVATQQIVAMPFGTQILMCTWTHIQHTYNTHTTHTHTPAPSPRRRRLCQNRRARTLLTPKGCCCSSSSRRRRSKRTGALALSPARKTTAAPPAGQNPQAPPGPHPSPTPTPTYRSNYRSAQRRLSQQHPFAEWQRSSSHQTTSPPLCFPCHPHHQRTCTGS